MRLSVLSSICLLKPSLNKIINLRISSLKVEKMTSCAIRGCPITHDNRPDKVALHRFPVVAEMRQKWMEATKITKVNTNTSVCSLHFDENSICSVSRNIKIFFLSVPSINLTVEEATQLKPGPLRIKTKTKNQKRNVTQDSNSIPLLQNIKEEYIPAPPICRVCMKADYPLDSLFNDTDDGDSIASKLMLVSSMQISAWDNRPQGICEECFRLLDATFTFKLLCDASEKFFEATEKQAELDAINKAAEDNENNTEELPDVKAPKEKMLGPKKFVCDKCGWAFRFVHNLRAHEYTHTGERPFKCTECKCRFTTSGNLSVHKRKHTGETPFVCDVCGKSFSTSTTLKSHCRQHTGEKPFTCAICGKTFANNSSLNIHNRRHTGQNSHACKICQRTFPVSSDLETHLRKHTGERPFPCKYCDHRSASKAYLKVHMRRHTGEKQFQCDICQRWFGVKATLVNHLRTHTGEQPFKCDVCDRRFAQQCALVAHQVRHTGIKRYACDCGAKYGWYSGLRDHKLKCRTALASKEQQDSFEFPSSSLNVLIKEEN